MFRAGVKGPNPLIVCGLSDGNITRLKAGQPIKAELRSFGVDLPGNLCIFHGTTEADIEVMLRRHGLIDEQTQGTTDLQIIQEAAIRAEHKHILIATVGLPRSGKSSWAQQQAYPIVSPDAIRLAMHGQAFIASVEPYIWAIARTMVGALFLAGHRHVILDATNISRKRRNEWKSPDWALYFKPIPTPASACHERATATGRDDLHAVIDRMASEAELIAPDEQVWP
jgi:predicted kinase